MAACAARRAVGANDRGIDPRLAPTEELFIWLPGDVAICVRNDLFSVTTYVLVEQEDWFEPDSPSSAAGSDTGCAPSTSAPVTLVMLGDQQRAGPPRRARAGGWPDMAMPSIATVAGSEACSFLALLDELSPFQLNLLACRPERAAALGGSRAARSPPSASAQRPVAGPRMPWPGGGLACWDAMGMRCSAGARSRAGQAAAIAAAPLSPTRCAVAAAPLRCGSPTSASLPRRLPRTCLASRPDVRCSPVECRSPQCRDRSALVGPAPARLVGAHRR